MDNIFNIETKHAGLQGQQQSQSGSYGKLHLPRVLVSGHHWCISIKMAEIWSTKPKKVEQIKEEGRVSVTNVKSPKIKTVQRVTQTIILHKSVYIYTCI